MTIAACPPATPVTPGVVVFDFTEFSAIYPEFVSAGGAACGFNFNLATMNLSNCCRSPVPNPAVRQSLLYLLTAHITFLFTPCAANNNQPPGMVGRINSASQGSVSVSAEFPASVNAAWFLQTRYGALFWQATASLRTMRYTPAPQSCDGFGPNAPFPGAGGWRP